MTNWRDSQGAGAVGRAGARHTVSSSLKEGALAGGSIRAQGETEFHGQSAVVLATLCGQSDMSVGQKQQPAYPSFAFHVHSQHMRIYFLFNPRSLTSWKASVACTGGRALAWTAHLLISPQFLPWKLDGRFITLETMKPVQIISTALVSFWVLSFSFTEGYGQIHLLTFTQLHL